MLYRYAHLPSILQVVAIGLIAIDTGGIHWGIANMVYQAIRHVVVSGVVQRFFATPYGTELIRPWKLITLSIGVGLLIWGSFYYHAPDWDIAISLIMALFAYLTASWSMHVMVERQWRQFPLMLLATWWTVDGCYALYWFFENPFALETMRSANAPASLSLYWMCGLVWYWNGSIKALFERVPLGLRLYAIAKALMKIIVWVLLVFGLYLSYYWWDMQRLRAFCDEIKPGTAVADLPRIADKHGFSPKWVRLESFTNASSIPTTDYVPSPASVGANVCAIRHNKEVVISTEIQID